ncbi:MAG: hypothetical protein K2H95_09775 [Bacteroidales bacterium]|nr:hypothetical protein [Bacteroidales bacterium]MDE6146985.1 hypothetical protein [Bacteroidales bacterium]
MRTFIEQYLQNPSDAIALAQGRVNSTDWMDSIDDEMIYSQLATPEFRLYEEIIFCNAAEDAPRANNYSHAA